MKKYRIRYQYVLKSSDTFNHKGDIIDGLSFDVVFRIIKNNGEEEIFDHSNQSNYTVNFDGKPQIPLLLAVIFSYDAENGLKVSDNYREQVPLRKSCIQFEITNYYKEVFLPSVGFIDTQLMIEAEFMSVLNQYSSYFDNTENNNIILSPRYFAEEIFVAKKELNSY